MMNYTGELFNSYKYDNIEIENYSNFKKYIFNYADADEHIKNILISQKILQLPDIINYYYRIYKENEELMYTFFL